MRDIFPSVLGKTVIVQYDHHDLLDLLENIVEAILTEGCFSLNDHIPITGAKLRSSPH